MFLRHLLDFSLPPSPPSPRLSGDNGGVSSSHSSTNNLTPSIVVITTIVIGVVVLSATVHLLLRYINRHCNLIESDEEEEEDEVVMANIEPAIHVHQRISSRRVAPDDDHHKNLIDSLPLFSFNSINNLAVADCAVCLSKFEPHDQLRLLPICCHAFHSNCIDTWLASSDTCPLCRSTVHVAESDGYLKLFSASTARENSSSSRQRSNSFRIEIGSVSRRRVPTDSGRFRSYSMGSFEYLVDDELEVEVEVVVAEPPTHSHSDGEKKDGGDVSSSEVPPPGSSVAAEMASGRGWLKDYVERLVSSSASSLSSRSRSFSGRFFTGSGRRRSDGGGGFSGGGSWDLEASGYGEEISSFFRWLSGV